MYMFAQICKINKILVKLFNIGDFKLDKHKACIWLTRSSALLLLSCLMYGCHQSRSHSNDSVAEFSAYLDEEIPILLGKYIIPGACIALVHEGKIVWSNAYGFADLEHNRSMTLDAVCRVESISKSVTAWGAMRLVENGMLDLDTPIRKYLHNWTLPETKFDQERLTLRSLLSGTSGLALGTIGKKVEFYPNSPLPTLIDYLNEEVKFLNEPGSRFMYSNVGFNMIEFIIEEVTGRKFSDYMSEEILFPLGMKHSSFSWDPSFHASIPTGYELDGISVPPYVYPASASGGLFATVEDIARFVSAGISAPQYSHNSVLKRETIDLIHEPSVEIPGLFGLVAEHYGFGHFIETLSDGRKAIWHGGQGHGWMTHFHSIPESGDGIIILTNSQRSWPFMAQILTDWSEWLEIEPVKMGRISSAAKVLWLFIILVFLVSVLQTYRLISGILSGRKSFETLSLKYHFKSLFQILISLTLIGFLAWIAFQPYLFVSSIFPTTSNWAAYSILAFSTINAISAFFPTKHS